MLLLMGEECKWFREAYQEEMSLICLPLHLILIGKRHAINNGINCCLSNIISEESWFISKKKTRGKWK